MVWLKLLGRKLTTLKQLSFQDRWLLMGAFVGLIFVAIALPRLGLKMTQNILIKLPQIRCKVSDSEREKRVSQTAAMVKIATRYCQSFSNCLKQSLVLWELLYLQRIESELRIGVRRDRGEFEAHAWVEYQGIALNEIRDVREDFATFDRIIC
ncbi:lasso peptide biosynthesis B2 protein [Spirulina sp. 06S082]|uniref:lasso peptide biosynthesis B2 protein n=1 Tax=Spirulina sp. 06S082 TaxID=3110248 RepID=UPI002B2114FD|nr:lasso peptide biosynthesis B2 protein [Spirulina sp. 06S082]MEA5471521.1 lasso peptide biosynthesis B2 protein [Spirulina sp. 06S082]